MIRCWVCDTEKKNGACVNPACKEYGGTKPNHFLTGKEIIRCCVCDRAYNFDEEKVMKSAQEVIRLHPEYNVKKYVCRFCISKLLGELAIEQMMVKESIVKQRVERLRGYLNEKEKR